MSFLFDAVLTIMLAPKPEPSTFMNTVMAYTLKRAYQWSFIAIFVPVRFSKMCLMISNRLKLSQFAELRL